MAGSFELWMQGTPASPEFYDRLGSLEVEENADLPGALQLRLPVAPSGDGDLTAINEAGLGPMAKIAAVATAEGQPPECVFDGVVLSHKLHLETGTVSSYVDVYAQDASWLMNLEEKTREWPNATDATAANAIFGEYGIVPGPDNLSDDSPTHTEDGHTLMQRATDLEFLRMLARRTGKLCRVVCASIPGVRTGVFAKPNVGAEPVASLRPNDSENPNVRAVDIEWDVMRPANVRARQALFTSPTSGGVAGDANNSGLAAMDERDLATFAGQAMTIMLAAPVDDGGELRQRAEAVLRDAGWFVRCTGETDAASLHRVLRVGTVVRLETVGSVHSGNYLVWSVQHKFDAQSHKMRFVLVRNAVGPAPACGGLLGG